VGTLSDSAMLLRIQERLAAEFTTLPEELVEAAVRVADAQWRGLGDDDLSDLVEVTAAARLGALL
jgi:hypothetical protein